MTVAQIVKYLKVNLGTVCKYSGVYFEEVQEHGVIHLESLKN